MRHLYDPIRTRIGDANVEALSGRWLLKLRQPAGPDHGPATICPAVSNEGLTNKRTTKHYTTPLLYLSLY